ncbi:hypothetical protein GCM10010400_39890 [Streptomyces aculeolatus]|uniref:TIM-barrel domain-containing protein n=1 Tax=Streptomyces aculeolatus TaxID=270689 RepID=UPI001CED9180|nr:TIM-barrel domain-containing protein [Streptomyces aculeolatus]
MLRGVRARAVRRTLLPALPLALLPALLPPAQAAQPAPAERGAGVPGVAGSAGSPAGYRVSDRGRDLVVTGGTYRMTIAKDGFRYGFERRDGTAVAPPHAASGLRVKSPGDAEFADAESARLVSAGRSAAVLDVRLADGGSVRVVLRPQARSVGVAVTGVPASSTVDLRTGHVGPAYGLGDHGSFGDGRPETGTPCSGKVEARPRAELTGLVLDNVTNQGSCKRFVSTFAVFPRQSFAEVLFAKGQKRVGLTEAENRLGVAGADGVDGLHYFLGTDVEQLYADYRRARHAAGYADVRPRPQMFELGWEAYGALGWNTYQSSVETTVRDFLDRGYPLGWGVVGSGFWPGERGNPAEGTTNSFGMWDDTAEEGRDDGLPNPRYPDPEALKRLFASNDVALLLGARNNFKAGRDDGGNHNPVTDAGFMEEARSRGYLLADADGEPVKVTRAQFPSGASYVLDGRNPEAVDWYVAQTRKWGVDGWKEDTMLYTPDLWRDGNWNALLKALHDAGDAVMVRNTAYSLPGDWARINDTIYGTGAVYHEDPDRMPVNLLNIAASGHGNLYPDFVGGTPGKAEPTDPAYRAYFARNVQFNALTPVLGFGQGPWQFGDDIAADAKKLALWHDSLHPYIYDAVLDGHASGFPYAMTPLHLAYPADERTYGLVDESTRRYEWMLGESLLAAPVWGSDFATATGRDVYLPAGTWIDVNTGERHEGPVTLTDHEVARGDVPAFVGGKGVLVRRVEAGSSDRLRAQVFPVTRGSVYSYGDGKRTSRIVNANAGWSAKSLKVLDTTASRAVDFSVDPVTGAVGFPLRAGHDYRLVGGRA